MFQGAAFAPPSLGRGRRRALHKPLPAPTTTADASSARPGDGAVKKAVQLPALSDAPAEPSAAAVVAGTPAQVRQVRAGIGRLLGIATHRDATDGQQGLALPAEGRSLSAR